MQRLFWVLRWLLIASASLIGSVAAQNLEVAPWLPVGGDTTLTGAGFKPSVSVSLSFQNPKPSLKDGKPVPASVQTNALGEFRLALRLSAPRLAVTARAGAQTVSLLREPPVLEPVIDGTSVITRQAQQVVARYYLSGTVTNLERTLDGFRATVKTLGGLDERFTIEGGRILERVTYPPSPALLTTLESATRVKTAIADPVTFWRDRAGRDPTNPFLTLELGNALQRSSDPSALEVLRSALSVDAPFYVFVRLAARLEALRQPDLASAALERAGREFARAGYDPGFAVSKSALAAWGDPLGVARRLLAAQNPVRAGVWLEYLRLTTPRFPGYGAVYAEYASFLEGQNQSGAASDWRKLSAELDAETIFSLGDQGLTRLPALAAVAVMLLLACFLALQFVLLLKYYPQQTRDLQPHGGRFAATSQSPLLRLRYSLSAYQTFTEKLLSALLLALAVLAMGVWQYAGNASRFLASPALAQGTAGGVDYYQALRDLPAQSSAFLTGLGAQLDGDAGRALESYRAAPLNAAAINNAAAILKARGDAPGATGEWSRALSLEPTGVAAKVNLGQSVTGYRAAFHEAYRRNTPMLELPSPRQLTQLQYGGVEEEFLRMVVNPWGYLLALPLGLPEWLMTVVAVLTLLLLAVTLLWLVIPRVRSAASAPRSLLYHMGALLIPGSGLADEVWGIILLLPTALIAALLSLHFFASTRLESLFQATPILGVGKASAWYDIGLNLQTLVVALVAIYVVNFVGWLLETIAVARRRARAKALSAVAKTP